MTTRQLSSEITSPPVVTLCSSLYSSSSISAKASAMRKLMSSLLRLLNRFRKTQAQFWNWISNIKSFYTWLLAFLNQGSSGVYEITIPKLKIRVHKMLNWDILRINDMQVLEERLVLV